MCRPREDELADTAPKQPLALTLGAAAVTVVVIIGVLAGPSIVNCFDAEGGMGQCLRGEMVEAGMLPQPAVAALDPATPVTDLAAAASSEPETALAEPAPDVAPPASQPADSVVAANFGLLRAEPDGSVVIAGSGTPGSEVEVYANDDLLGTAKVEPSGDWVLVPEEPLPAGGLEITLGEAGKEGRAEESFVVAINENKSTEPLVVASTPGAASEVLQGLTPAESQTQIAAAAPATPAVPQSAAEAQPTDAATAPQQTATATENASSTPATATETETEPAAPQAPASTPAAPQTAAAPGQPAPAAPSAFDAPATAAHQEPADAEPEPTAVATIEPAPNTPEAAAPSPATAGVAPTIDAIEIEGNRTFFAGAGPEDADIRLYVDDQFVSDAKVSDGRWLVEAGPVLKQPSQRVRIDMLATGSAKVASRAEVNFMVEAPVEQQIAAAATDAPVSPPEPDVPSTAAAPSTASPAQTPAPAAPPLRAEIAPAAAPAAEPANAPTTAEPAAAAPAADTGSDEQVPTMVGVSVGGPDAERFAAGKAIIRRGDNLWTIARRVYGRGMKYTTIYEANTGQIRDPNRIYPGQVFALPEETAN